MSAAGPARLTVDEAERGLRLDAFLVRRGLAPSAAAARRLLLDGGVRIEGGPPRVRKGERLMPGQVVEVVAPSPEGDPAQPDATAVAAPSPLAVLHLDEALVAIDKPPGIPSHPLRPGERDTAVSALLARYPECQQASLDPREGGLVHRLDTGTSGVLVAARHRQSWQQLRQSFSGQGCTKTYVAEVVGLLPDGPARSAGAHLVDVPIGRVGRRGGHVRIGVGRSPMEARTEVRVLRRRSSSTLVEARLERGRPHQVRVHLAHLGFPVVGDGLYGPEREGAEAGTQRLLHLHAWKVRFPHPTSGAVVEIEAPLPAWAQPR